MSEFRERHSALNDAVADYYKGDDLLIEKEKELELITETVEKIKADQVEKMKKIWDAENELHSLMPEDYKNLEEQPQQTSSWGLPKTY